MKSEWLAQYWTLGQKGEGGGTVPALLGASSLVGRKEFTLQKPPKHKTRCPVIQAKVMVLLPGPRVYIMARCEGHPTTRKPCDLGYTPSLSFITCHVRTMPSPSHSNWGTLNEVKHLVDPQRTSAAKRGRRNMKGPFLDS